MNAEAVQFNPLDLDLSRSTFHGSPSRTGTMMAGRLVPFFTCDVMPGDEFTFDVNSLIKMSTPIYPTMDLLFADVFAFYVPNRLVLSRRYGNPSITDANESWEAIIGAQDNLINCPLPSKGVELPHLAWSGTSAKLEPGSLLDYFDIDTEVGSGPDYNCLELLSYFAIWNENFREPSTMLPVTWSFSSAGALVPYGQVPLYVTRAEYDPVRGTGTFTNYRWTNALSDQEAATAAAVSHADKWLPFPVCRFHGYFGSMLPWPQRNAQGVALPGFDGLQMAPVITQSGYHSLGEGPGYSIAPLTWANKNDPTGATGASSGLLFASSSDTTTNSLTPGSTVQNAVPRNLYADLAAITTANVNALRFAVQQQRWYEKLARSGNRYDELEYGTFGVRPHDSGDDRPRYLGGKRITLNMDMVASTNGGTTASPGAGAGSLGSLGAFSHTNDNQLKIHAGFDDWGTVMFLVCIRHHDMFGSGTAKRYLRKTREDYYFPTFAALGEQPITYHELVTNNISSNRAIGYQEAWQENRVWLDTVHGLCRPDESLGYMTYANKFDTATFTLADFLNASSQVKDIDRTLSVSSNAAGFQFVYQFNVNITARRPLPTHSIPGLMDHL